MTAPDLLRQLANCMEERDRLEAENVALRAELEATKSKVPTEEKRWYSNAEAARFIGRSQAYLNKDRLSATHLIPYTRTGYRSISYDRADLQAFLDARKSRKKETKK